MSKQTILLVDDNPDDVELTIRVFKAHHIANEVIVAQDGAEALNLLFGESSALTRELPSVVVLDLNMPSKRSMNRSKMEKLG